MQSEISERHVAIRTFRINFCLAAFLSQPCGHKHVHNLKKFLLPSFDSPVARSTFTINKKFLLRSFHSTWIIVTIIDYIDNKRYSIVILLLFCDVKSIVGGWGGSFFFVVIITIMKSLGCFILVAISTISDKIYLHFFSRCNDEKKQ